MRYEQSTLLPFLNGYRHKRIPQLNDTNSRRLNLRANLIVRFVNIFGIWPIVLPIVMILLYLVHAKDTKYFARFIAEAGFTVFFLVMFSINLLSSMVREAAHKSINVLYTFLFRVKVSTAQRMKIMAFIEKLSGPDIGFYCWELFPMNNYEYYQYVANCACTYFLVLGFI